MKRIVADSVWEQIKRERERESRLHIGKIKMESTNPLAQLVFDLIVDQPLFCLSSIDRQTWYKMCKFVNQKNAT